ncbi:MAG: RNA polymerase sigma factor [Acidimicrobiales bacterium]
MAADEAADSYVQLYRAHYPRLVQVLVLTGARRDDAEDVAQEAFARTLSRWRRVRTGSNPPGYVYRVAFRLLRRAQPHLVGDGHAPSPAVAAADDAVVLHTSLEQAFAGLPPRQRTCALLCLLLGYTSEDAGSVLGIRASTVRKQVELARRSLRQRLTT